MNRKLMQVRDLFAMRAHLGWGYVLLSRIAARVGGNSNPLGRTLENTMKRMHKRTRRRSEAFDAAHGTDTFRRLDVRVSSNPTDDTVWGYSAINRDFLREILRSIPQPLAPYTFVDVGSGKGAAVLFAGEFPFRKLMGVELTPELIEIARRNVDIYNQKTGRTLNPEWIHCDFFKWEIPNEPQLFFFNNPFPESITWPAIEVIERSLTTHPRPALLVFRKAPKVVGDQLHQSNFWKPLRLAPFWRIYAAS